MKEHELKKGKRTIRNERCDKREGIEEGETTERYANEREQKESGEAQSLAKGIEYI